MSKSLVEIFEDGLLARDRGLTCDDNPYPNGSPEYQAWDEGCVSSIGGDDGGKTDRSTVT